MNCQQYPDWVMRECHNRHLSEGERMREYDQMFRLLEQKEERNTEV